MTRTTRINAKILFCFAVIAALSSCSKGPRGSLNIPSSGNNNAAAPVRLGGSGGQTPALVQSDFSIKVAINEAAAKRAIENYRINKKAPPGPFKYAGADLNGDGLPELIVLYTGRGWCARTGCTLAVLSPSNSYSYETVSTTRRVKPPIIISPQRTNGWHDIHIRTGLAIFPKSHKMTLKFSGRGYPGNAVTLTPLPRRTELSGDQLFPALTFEEREYIKMSLPN